MLGEQSQAQANGDTGNQREDWAVRATSISLLRGGDVALGIGEKYAANSVTGAGSMLVLIAINPGRSGFGQLTLTNEYGPSNGPFGFGWRFSLPSLIRKGDKGVPQHLDALDWDVVFFLSDADDLASEYLRDVNRTWVAKHPGCQRDPAQFRVRGSPGVIHEDDIDGYASVAVARARASRVSSRASSAGHLCSPRLSSTSQPVSTGYLFPRDNILNLYGFDAESRIADPLDSGAEYFCSGSIGPSAKWLSVDECRQGNGAVEGSKSSARRASRRCPSVIPMWSADWLCTLALSPS